MEKWLLLPLLDKWCIVTDVHSLHTQNTCVTLAFTAASVLFVQSMKHARHKYMLGLTVGAWLTPDGDEVLFQWLNAQTTEWTSGLESWLSRSSRESSSTAYVSVPFCVCVCFHPASVVLLQSHPASHRPKTSVNYMTRTQTYTHSNTHTHLGGTCPFHIQSSRFSFLTHSLCLGVSGRSNS